jgi:hypothetical protein
MHISLPEDLIAKIEDLFFDPARGKPIYGIHAFLVRGLYEKWLEDPSIFPIDIEEVTNDRRR